MYTLTQNECEIMELLWREQRALTRSEIIDMLPNKSWSDKSIHILLNNMLEKGALVVDGHIKTNTNFGRTYAATISQIDYTIMQLKNNIESYKNDFSVFDVCSALIKKETINSNIISELEQTLMRRKMELNE